MQVLVVLRGDGSLEAERSYLPALRLRGHDPEGQRMKDPAIGIIVFVISLVAALTLLEMGGSPWLN